MLTILLLVVIYLSFISLGLPDSLLGAAIPAIHLEWGIPLGAGGAVSMIITAGTVVSSFLSGFIVSKFGTGKVTLISCLLTGLALLGFSLSPSFGWLFLFSVPLGIGAGSVDTALNNYVARHFKAHHMNWLHSFWGVGATVGPLILSFMMKKTGSWQIGYRTIAFIQLGLGAILAFSLPLWKRHEKKQIETLDDANLIGETKVNLFSIKGVPAVLLTMLLYCSVEVAAGLWGTSFLVSVKGASVETAASWIALYYGGITLGRFAAGFISFRLNNTQRIRLGLFVSALGVLILLFPLPILYSGIGFVLLGLGLAPIYPAMIHETPKRFGRGISQKVIGFQMGFAYIGTAVMPPLFGVLLQYGGPALLPFLLGIVLILLIIISERLRLLFR